MLCTPGRLNAVDLDEALASGSLAGRAGYNWADLASWYFWVAMIAIAASGAAITAIAVKAVADEQPDELTPSGGRIRFDQGFGIRF